MYDLHAGDLAGGGEAAADTWLVAASMAAAAPQGLMSPDSVGPESPDTNSDALGTASIVGMHDLLWKKCLHGKHHEEILAAHQKEFDGLTSTIPKELFPGDAEYRAAQQGTNCWLILEFKCVSVWKVKCVIQGFREDCLALDGADFKYNSDVAGLMAIHNVMFDPIKCNTDGSLDDIMLSSIDAAYAYLQSDLFPVSCPPRYIKVWDPVSRTMRYFLQYGVLYGSRSSTVQWQQTLHL